MSLLFGYDENLKGGDHRNAEFLYIDVLVHCLQQPATSLGAGYRRGRGSLRPKSQAPPGSKRSGRLYKLPSFAFNPLACRVVVTSSATTRGTRRFSVQAERRSRRPALARRTTGEASATQRLPIALLYVL